MIFLVEEAYGGGVAGTDPVWEDAWTIPVWGKAATDITAGSRVGCTAFAVVGM